MIILVKDEVTKFIYGRAGLEHLQIALPAYISVGGEHQTGALTQDLYSIAKVLYYHVLSSAIIVIQTFSSLFYPKSN